MDLKHNLVRKVNLLILFWCFSVRVLYSQISGNGTAGDPYRGDVITNTTWSISGGYTGNIVYASNIYIVEAFTLTVSPGLTVLFNGSLVINGSLIVKSGAAITAGSIFNGGLLKLESEYSGSASVIFDSYSGPGNTQVQMYLSGGYNTSGGTNYYKWHYISTPTIDPIPTAIFTANTLDLAQYIETNVDSDNTQGWVAFDGYNYYDQVTIPGQGFNQLIPGKGYNYYNGSDQTYLISSTLNSQDVNIALTCGSGNPMIHGYNLIGNPFPSSFDWDYLYVHNLIPPLVDDAIYFTINDHFASYVGGIGQGGGTGSIPPMQGFFIKANGATAINLPTAARMHKLGQLRYKKGLTPSYRSADSVHLLRLEFNNAKDSDDLVIRFEQQASSLFDKSFDAYKFNKAGPIISIWSKTGDIAYSINSLPFPETTTEIPIGIFASSEGTYKISLNEIIKIDNFNIFLKDLSTNISANLTKGEELTFHSASGLNEDRFILTVTNITTGMPDLISPEKKFTIYSTAGAINILSLSHDFENTPGLINLYDMTGKKVLGRNAVEFNKGELNQLYIDAGAGLYFVEISAGKSRYVEKVRFVK